MQQTDFATGDSSIGQQCLLCVTEAVIGRTLGRLLTHVLVVYNIILPNNSRFGPGTTSKTQDPVWCTFLVLRWIRGAFISSWLTVLNDLCP